MKFSIIIPTLNEENNIQQCLAALNVFKTEIEIIVVDGGSTDSTFELARPLADKTIKSPKGRARQMNAGATTATGDILVFLHVDTFLPENFLALIHPEDNLWGRFDIQLKGNSAMLKIISTFMNWRSRITGIATGDQAIFVSKELFDKVGAYSDIALMEDIDLSTKLKKTNFPLCLKEKVSSSGRRWEKFGVTRTILLMWSIRLRYFFGENPDTLSILYSRGLFWKP